MKRKALWKKTVAGTLFPSFAFCLTILTSNQSLAGGSISIDKPIYGLGSEVTGKWSVENGFAIIGSGSTAPLSNPNLPLVEGYRYGTFKVNAVANSLFRKDAIVFMMLKETKPGGVSEDESNALKAYCTVAKLLDIVGNLGGDFNCFANFDHFYAGNLGSANALELSLKYLPDDLLHSDLPADWTLEGEGTLPYSKDAAEPKWKGKVSLGEESFGTVDFTAKWGTMEAKKSFTKFKVGILRDEGEHDLWVLKDKTRTTTAKYIAKVLPDSMNNEFPEAEFDWTAFPSPKAKIKTSGDRSEFCSVTPQGYHKHQTSRKDDDVQLISSWKCPSESPRPYHTATEIETLTVRTPVYIRMVAWEDLSPEINVPGWKKFRLHYAVFDNLKKQVKGKVIEGLEVKEKWVKDVLPDFWAEYGNIILSGSGTFWDDIGGACGVRDYSGIQWLTCDHINGSHTVQINLLKFPPATITVSDVIAPTY